MATAARTMNGKGTTTRARRAAAPGRTPRPVAHEEEEERASGVKTVINMTEITLNIGLPFVVRGSLVTARRGARRALRMFLEQPAEHAA